MDTGYRPVYASGFDEPYLMNVKLSNMSEEPIRNLNSSLTDTKSIHHIEKLKGLFKKLKQTASNDNLLDTLNASEVAVLKIREFRSYVKHHFSSYNANLILNSLFEDSVNFSKELFRTIFTGLQFIDARDIIVKGYCSMRKFIYKI